MSSLMARLKATQGVQPMTNLACDQSPEQLSSLAAAAAAAAAASTTSTTSAAKNSYNGNSSYVPQYKKNPLNYSASSSTINRTISNDTTNNYVDDKIITNSISNMSAPKITLVEQLIQRQQSPYIPPPPFSMCSKSEAYDRQEHLELSPLECNPGSISSGVISISSSLHSGKDSSVSVASQKAAARRCRPTFNPQYVIKKYRRSAAGGGILSEASDQCPRTLDQLETTVNYLLEGVFANQMPPPSSANGCDHTNNNNVDPNELSLWEADNTPIKSKANADPNELSIWEADNTPIKSKAQQHSPFTLSETVSFVDDRLRAVQKDLVTLLGNTEEQANSFLHNNSVSAKREQVKQQRIKQTVREMQAKMVRYNILASYLLSDVPSSKYEVKFGARALRTSLTCYLNLSTDIHEEYQNLNYPSQYQKECQTKDEIMAYMALLHSQAVLNLEEATLTPPTSGEMTSSLMEDSGSGWGAVLSTFNKNVLKERDKIAEDGVVEKFPRWKWALKLACVAQEGNYQCYFSLLQKGPTYFLPFSSADKALAEVDAARFLILARCCTSHSLNLVRLAQLRRYNHAFGKGEEVSSTDLARLLRMGISDDEVEGSQSAIELCRALGLPVVEKEVLGDNYKEKALFVVMKSGPISVKGDESIQRVCCPGRTNDAFVFGSRFKDGNNSDDVTALAEQMVECAVDDWEDTDENDAKSTIASNGTARGDKDGVLIPSSNILRGLAIL